MANINWDSQELESTAAQVNTLLQNYDKTMDEIQQTLNTMEFRLKLRTDVDNDLSKLKRRVSQERSKMQQVRQTVNLAASTDICSITLDRQIPNIIGITDKFSIQVGSFAGG